MGSGNLHYAVLGLVAARPEGVHGYQLKTEVEALCDDFWQVNYGRLYRVLDTLERTGELSGFEIIQRGRPNRKVYRITSKGERRLDDWLLQPVSDDPRPLRDELSLKLMFLRPPLRGKIQEFIHQQRRIYMNKLAGIARRRRMLAKAELYMSVTELVLEGVEMRVRADLAWLEHVERKLAEETGSGEVERR
ncbi:MAG: helix-turn-helix transcriptional regulator [Candidatus Binatia bacterium]